MFDDDLRGTLTEQRRLQEEGGAQRNLQLALALGGALALGLLCSWVFSRWLRGVLASYAAERERTEVDLRIAAIAFEAQEGMVVTDANSTILRVNRAFTRITGYAADEVIGKTPSPSSHRAGTTRCFTPRCTSACKRQVLGLAKSGTGAKAATCSPNG